MSKRRKFTAAFKSQVVLELLSGEKAWRSSAANPDI
jgi:transposase-like protein